jgi:hypothetical protein
MVVMVAWGMGRHGENKWVNECERSWTGAEKLAQPDFLLPFSFLFFSFLFCFPFYFLYFILFSSFNFKKLISNLHPICNTPKYPA